MKNTRIINLSFIGIVALLVVLAILALVKKPFARQAAAAELTPTLDVALSVTQTMQAVAAATQTAQPTSTPLPPTPTITATVTATPLVVPDSFYLYGFVGHTQAYSIGCETSVAVDLAKYYDVYLTEYEFQTSLPHSDNPDKGFVGSVYGLRGQIPPVAYGVHAAPVADLLNQYGVPVEGGKGYTLDQIKAALSQSKPVIVWVIGHMEYSDPVQYTDKEGDTSIVAPYEHVVVLTGYNETTVRYNNNGHYADVDIDTFLTSWGVLGNMALFHQ